MSEGIQRETRALSTTSSRVSGGLPGSGVDRQIAGLIGRLLLHYWTENMPASMREAQAQDWLEDLREFGPEVVSIACMEWRRTESRRPTPADIRKLAIEARRDERERRQRDEHRLLDAPDFAEARREDRAAKHDELAAAGRKLTDGWARQKGYRDFDDYLDAGGTYKDAWDDMRLNGIGASADAGIPV